MFTCIACGVEIFPKPHMLKRGRGKTCSLACAASLAAANRDQSGAANPNWKGGVNNTENKRRYRRRHPQKYVAHKTMWNAIRNGELERMPCELCGSLDVEGHHEDYAKPLAVRWLCKKHHLAVHRAA